MRHFQIPSSRSTARLLCIMCLLLATAGLTFAQSDPTISINDIAVNERDANLFGHEFRVSLSAASSKTINVTVSTQAGTATDNSDFGAGSVTLTFQPGLTSQTVTVFIIGDTVVEGTEHFFLNLSNPVNTTIADGQGLGTIVDDDTLVLLTQQGSQRALAVDSVFQTLESYAINTGELPFFSSDKRMRISLMAIGLKGSNVTATAEDSVGTIRPLTVEFVGKPATADWITQVVVKLNDQITPAQDIKVKITVDGVSSNTVLVAVKPQ